MEARVNVDQNKCEQHDFSPRIRVEFKTDPELRFGGVTQPDAIGYGFFEMILNNENLEEKFFGRFPEVKWIKYYVNNMLRIEMRNPRIESVSKRFPERHRAIFKDKVRIRVRELHEKVNALEQSSHDVETVESEYRVCLHSLWSTEGEKSIENTDKGQLKDLIQEVEQEFLKINNRSDIQAKYEVFMIVNGLDVSLPKEEWEEFTFKNK